MYLPIRHLTILDFKVSTLVLKAEGLEWRW